MYSTQCTTVLWLALFTSLAVKIYQNIITIYTTYHILLVVCLYPLYYLLNKVTNLQVYCIGLMVCLIVPKQLQLWTIGKFIHVLTQLSAACAMLHKDFWDLFSHLFQLFTDLYNFTQLETALF